MMNIYFCDYNEVNTNKDYFHLPINRN